MRARYSSRAIGTTSAVIGLSAEAGACANSPDGRAAAAPTDAMLIPMKCRRSILIRALAAARAMVGRGRTAWQAGLKGDERDDAHQKQESKQGDQIRPPLWRGMEDHEHHSFSLLENAGRFM